MKKLKILILAGILAFSMSFLFGCSKPRLSRPSGLTVDEGVTLLSWNSVAGAQGYLVRIEGEDTRELSAQRAYYDISTLPTNVEYSFSVKALGDHVVNDDSDWSEPCKVFKEWENGLSFRAVNGNTEYELSGIGVASGDLEVGALFRGKPVIGIADSAFYNDARLTSLKFSENTIRTIGERAFQNCSELNSIVIPEGVVSIGRSAFRNCKKITSITLPDSLRVLGEDAFAYCSALTEIKFGSGLVEISQGAFRNCSSLKNVEIPDTIASIGQMAFDNCELLEEVKMGSGVLMIGQSAFNNCKVLSSINLSGSLLYIMDSAFRSCAALEKLEFPESLLSIGSGAFVNCTALGEVSIGSRLVSVGQGSFLNTKIWNDAEAAGDQLVYADRWLVGCTDYLFTKEDGSSGDTINIRSDTEGIGFAAFYRPGGEGSSLAYIKYDGMPEGVNSGLPDSVRVVDAHAFRDCKRMYSLQMGKNVEFIGTSAFEGCSILARVDFSQNHSLVAIESNAFAATNLGYPGRDNGLPIQFAFPDTLMRVGQSAFSGSYYSRYYAQRNGVVYVGGWVVECTNTEIENVTILPSVADTSVSADQDGNYPSTTTVGIADYAFFNCQMMANITIPDTIRTIGRAAFMLCTMITELKIPEKVTEISDYTFYYCVSLRNIEFPEGLTSIGQSAFYSAMSLSEVTIPKGVTTIGDYAFFTCGQLQTLNFETGDNGESAVTYIGVSAFNQSALSSIEIPDSVLVIGDYAFFDNEWANTITIGKSVQSIGAYAFSVCSAVEELVIPDSVVSIGDCAFVYCEGLKSLVLGSGLESVGEFAFAGCSSLSHLSIPSNLKSIGKQAFRACLALKSAYLLEGTEEMDAHVFYECEGLTIYTDMESIPAEWSTRFDSSYCPIVFGCVFSSDGYVVSLQKTENTVMNLYSKNSISAPTREGYTFAGWATQEGGSVVYQAEELAQVENGTTLFAVWTEGRNE